jgi:hypothetical protein
LFIPAGRASRLVVSKDQHFKLIPAFLAYIFINGHSWLSSLYPSRPLYFPRNFNLQLDERIKIWCFAVVVNIKGQCVLGISIGLRKTVLVVKKECRRIEEQK